MSKFVIIPAHNEEKNIGRVLEEVHKLGLKPVVVDDGSTDKTFDISNNNGTIVLRHDVNKGKGETVKTGLDYILKNRSDFNHVVVIDADMQYHPEEMPKIFGMLETKNLDFVMGHREWDKVPFRHRLGNFVWRNAFNTMFNTKFKDTNCGIMGFNRNAVEKLKDSILGGYIVDNSILIGAVKNNLKVDQILVDVKYHRKSKVTRGVRIVLGVLLYILKEGFKYRIRRRK